MVLGAISLETTELENEVHNIRFIGVEMAPKTHWTHSTGMVMTIVCVNRYSDWR